MSTAVDTNLLKSRPGIQKFPARNVMLFQKSNFLSAEECAMLIEQIERDRRPSTIADANGDDAYRTSETCDLDMADPLVDAIDRKIAAYAGIDPAYGENIQGQRYDVGQEFKAHTDYFEPGGLDYHTHCAAWGQRTWTFMIYLNAPQAGGATRFTKVGKSFQPETGKLLAWNNRLQDGGCNGDTLHHGMKVRAGVKYIITKWYRERPCR
jgi:prolyl 4-hydroxylase